MSETRDEAKKLLAAATPGPWGTGEHVGEPRAICSTPRGMESLLGLDRDGMAICASAGDAALIAAAPTLIATLCDEADVAERRAVEADAGAAAMRRALDSYMLKWSNDGERCHECDGECGEHGCLCPIAAALANPAGRAILERLERLERAEAERDALRAELEKESTLRAELAAKVRRMEGCKAIACECVTPTWARGDVWKKRIRPGVWASDDCHNCHGRGAVIVEGET